MNIYHVKLRNGSDLICAGLVEKGLLHLEEPVEIVNDLGALIAVPWLQFSREKKASIPLGMVATVNEATDEAKSYYMAYLRRTAIESASGTDAEIDLQQIVEESRIATKH